MLKNFQLAVIVKQGRTTRLLRVPLYQPLQKFLSQSWQDQLDGFTQDVQKIKFNPGYTPEQHECFRLSNYELPDWLANEDSQSVVALDDITNNDTMLDATKGVVAFARSSQDNELILFQNFSLSHVIRPGFFLFLQGDTYKSIQRPGMTLENKISAIFLPEENSLAFRNFRNVNTFLPLADFYNEATEQDIREILDHDRLAPEDANTIATGANQWFSKRFAMLRDSKILDEFTTKEIVHRSIGHDVNVQVKGEQIVFPADRSQAKRLLQFLNEELYRGPITETLYETNSKREADK